MLFACTAVMNSILWFTRRWKKSQRGCWILFRWHTIRTQKDNSDGIITRLFCNLVVNISAWAGLDCSFSVGSQVFHLAALQLQLRIPCTFSQQDSEFIYPTASYKLLTQVPFDFPCPLPWLCPDFGPDTFDLLVFLLKLNRQHIQVQQV